MYTPGGVRRSLFRAGEDARDRILGSISRRYRRRRYARYYMYNVTGGATWVIADPKKFSFRVHKCYYFRRLFISLKKLTPKYSRTVSNTVIVLLVDYDFIGKRVIKMIERDDGLKRDDDNNEAEKPLRNTKRISLK